MTVPSVNPAKIDELLHLEEGWDSYGGAAKITSEALAAVNQLWIVPTVSGGVQIELHVRERDVEIEITSKGWIDSVVVA